MELDFRMKGDRISDENHIARYCKPTQAPDGQIQATAFMLRAGEESLSVNCLEFLNCSTRQSEIESLRRLYSAKLKVRGNARIAVLNSGEVRHTVKTESPDSRNLKILHDPLCGDPSHSGIYNLREDDELIAELILQTVQEIYGAR